MEKITFTPTGVCSRQIDIEISEGVIRQVKFTAGCPGNLTGIERLVTGLPVDEAVRRLKGIECGGKVTSCPDQLAMALEKSECFSSK